MKTKNLTRNLLYFVVIGISVFLLFFLITCSWIGYEVKSQCREAKREYGKDCVMSLTELLRDKNRSFRSRNSAIWALGQLGDKRVLPVLKSFYTGNVPSREPLNKKISQYELKKAIALAEGNLNISAIIWRIGYAEK